MCANLADPVDEDQAEHCRQDRVLAQMLSTPRSCFKSKDDPNLSTTTMERRLACANITRKVNVSLRTAACVDENRETLKEKVKAS